MALAGRARPASLDRRAGSAVRLAGSCVVGVASSPDQLDAPRGEVVAPLAVAAVPVERGAARRQQHRVAGLGQLARGRDRLVHRRGGDRPGARRRTRRRPRRRPRRWRRPRGCGARPRPSTERSRPLLRPPAMSTTESKPPTAASVAWGAVAFESSYHRTPPASPTSVDPVGEAAERRASAARTPSTVGARRRRRWPRPQRVGEVVREGARHSSAIARNGAPPGPGARRRADSQSASPSSPKVTGAPGPRRCGAPRGSSALATAIGRPGRGCARCGPWRPRSWRALSCTSRWSGAKLSQVATSARSRWLYAEPERRRLDHEHVGIGVVDGLDQRHVGVAGRHGAAARREEHVGRRASSRWSCRRCR